MKHKVEFLYEIGDSVTLAAIGVIARVDAMMVDISGKQYRVVYWDDGQRYSQWVYDWELAQQ